MGKSSSKLGRQSSSGGSTVEQELRNTQISDILDNEHLLAPFLTDVFYQEVELSDCMQTLFRGNCLASKIMSHCFRTFGSSYLKQLLEPHIKSLTIDAAIEHQQDHESTLETQGTAPDKFTQQQQSDPSAYSTKTPISSSISYEIDSARLEEDGDIDVNQKNLLSLTKQILDSILSSAADFPPQLNSMCICLRQVLSKKYPDSSSNLRAVGTVIFLRFINPAIVSPHEAGIIDRQPPSKTLRGLMLVSKILQNIANNVEFSKEEHMLPFNDFVRAHFEPVRQWVSEISSKRSDSELN